MYNKIPDFNLRNKEFLAIDKTGSKQKLITKKVNIQEITETASEVVSFLDTHQEFLQTPTEGMKSFSLGLESLLKAKKIHPEDVEKAQRIQKMIRQTLRAHPSPVKFKSNFQLPKEAINVVKVFGFIHGDTLIKNTGLEGGDIYDNFETLLPFLKQYADTPGFQEVIEAFQTSIDLFKLQNSIRFIKKDTFINLEELSNLTAKMVKELPPGKKILIPGGWNTHGGGHSMLYLAKKNEDGQFDFTVINTGRGLKFHESKQIGLKKKFPPIYSLKNVRQAAVEDPYFYQALYELNIAGTQDRRTIWTHDAEDIYERILPALGGTKDDSVLTEEDFATAQRSGTCSWKVIMKLLASHCSEGDYKAFIFRLRYESLISFFQYIRSNRVSDIEIDLLQRAVRNFSLYSVKQYKKGYIKSEDAKKAESLSRLLLSEVDKIYEANRKILKKAQTIKFTGDMSAVSYHVPNLPATSHTISMASPSLTGNTTPPGIREDYQKFNDLKDQIAASLSYTKDCIESGQSHLAVTHIQNLVSRLPLIEKDGDWDRLCKKCESGSILELMNQLGEVNQLYFTCLANPTLLEQGQPEHLATMTILLMMTSCLTRFLSKDHPLYFGNYNGIKPFTGTDAFSILVEQNPFIEIVDQKLGTQFKSALAYIDETDPNSSFGYLGYIYFNKGYGQKFYDFKFEKDGNLPKNLEDNLQGSHSLLVLLQRCTQSDKFIETFIKHFGKPPGDFTDKIVLEKTLPLMNQFYPRSIRMVINQVLLHNYLLRHPTLESLNLPLLPDPETASLSIDILPTRSKDQIQYTFSFSKSKQDFNDKPLEHENFLGSFDAHYQTHTSREESLKKLYKEMNTPIDSLTNWGYCIKGNKAVLLPASKGLDKRETQTLAYLTSNSKMTLPNLISLIHERPSLLQQTENHQFIKAFILSGEYLSEWRSLSPQLIEEFQNLIVEKMAFFKKLGDFRCVLFLIEMIQDIEKKTGIALNVEIAATTLFNEIGQETDGDKQLKSHAASLFIKGFLKEKEFTTEELKNILLAFSYLQLFGFGQTSPSIQNDVISTMIKVLPLAGNLLFEDQIELSKQVYREILQIEDPQIEITDAHCLEEKSQISIDLTSFIFYDHGYQLGPVPIHIRTHPVYLTLTGGKKVMPKIIEPGLFEFNMPNPSDKGDVTIRMFTSEETGEVIFLKKFDSGWHQILSSFQQTDIDIDQQELLWVSQDRKTIICEDLSGFYKSTLKYNPDIDRYELYKDKTPAVWGIQLDPLSAFQLRDDIFFWKDDCLIFSNLDLVFDIQKDKALLSTDPKLIISKSQAPAQSLPFFRGFLKLENQENQTFYLIPKSKLDLKKVRTGALGHIVSQKYEGDKYFKFEEVSGSLIGKNAEENLFLGFLHYASKNYEKAFDYLDQINAGNPKGYSESEKEIVGWMQEFMMRVNDESPQSIAVKLKFNYLIRRNLIPYDPEYKSNESLKNQLAGSIQNNLMSYYNLWSHVKQLKLNPAEEMDLLQWVLDHVREKPAILEERLQSLLDGVSKRTDNIMVQKRKVKKDLFSPIAAADMIITHSSLPSYIRAPIHSIFKEGEEPFRYLLRQLNSDLLLDPKFDPGAALTELQMYDFSKSYEKYSLEKTRNFYLSLLGQDRKAIDDFVKSLDRYQEASKIDRDKAKLNFIQDIKTLYDQNPLAMPSQPERVVIESVSEPKSKSAIKLNVPKDIKRPPDLFKSSLNKFPMLESIEDLETSKKLLELLKPQPNASPAEKRELERLTASILENERTLAKAKRYNLGEKEVQEIEKKSGNAILQLEKAVKQYEKIILALVNHLPKDKDEALIKKLKLYGKSKRDLTIDEVILAYAQNNAQFLLKANPALSQNDLDSIMKGAVVYLYCNTEWQYYSRIHKSSTDALEKLGTDEGEKMLSDIDQMIRETRHYDNFDLDRALLVFEYYSGFRLRENQVETIRSMLLSNEGESQNLITQLIMGSGKSKVILPLLAYLNSRGDNIPMIIVPDELYETSVADMQQFSKDLFQQKITTIEVPSDSALTSYDLKEILKKLDLLKQNRSYCIMKQSDIHSLRLQFRETLLELEQLPAGSTAYKEHSMKFELIKQLLNILKKEGDAIIDEVDLVLDCLKEVNFAGKRTAKPSAAGKDLIVDLLNVVNSNDKLNRFFMLESESSVPFNLDTFHAKIKPLLIDQYLNEKFSFDESHLQEIKNYLMKASSVKEIPQIIEDSDTETKAQLSCAKEIINTYFTLVFSKNCDENYGLSKTTKNNMAIPYARSNSPNEGSEFGNHYETLLYTALYYLRRGVQRDQVEQIVQTAREKVLQELEMLRGEEKDPKATNGYREFMELMGGDFLKESNIDLFNIQGKEIQTITDHFNRNVENRILFARKFAWNQLEIKMENLTSNAQHLVSLFHSVSGFTGTLWNQETFHPDLNPKPDLSVDGRTLSLLYRSDPNVMTFSDHIDDIPSFLDALNGYHACIDIGAWFRGISSYDVATIMLEYLDEETIKGIVYFNDVDIPEGTIGKAVILEKGNEIPIPLSESRLPPENRFTYYSITTGADIPQHPTAKAMVTVGKNMTTRDLLQGVWRMRGLESKQKVDFALPDNLFPSASPTLDTIFLHTIQNQAARQEADNLKSLKQKMNSIVDKVIDDVILYSDLDTDKAVEIVKQLNEMNLFIRRIVDDPYLVFGKPDTLLKIEEIIEQTMAATLKKLKKLKNVDDSFTEIIDMKSIKDHLNDLVHLDILPRFAYDKKQETEIEVQTKQSVKVENKVEMEQISEGRALTEGANPSQSWLKSLKFGKNFTPKISINSYLKTLVDDLDYKKEAALLFSPSIHLSDNFAKYCPIRPKAERSRFEDEIMKPDPFKGYGIPFKSGSKPFGYAALAIDPDGSLSYIFIDNNEADALSRILQFEDDFEGDRKDIEKRNQISKEIGDRIVDFISKLYMAEGLPTDELEMLKEKMYTYPDSLYQFQEKLDKTAYIIETSGDREKIKHYQKLIYEEYDQTLLKEFENRSQLIYEPWKPKITYEGAIKVYGAEKEGDLFLMDTQLGLIQEGMTPLPKEVLKSPEFIELSAQAKILRGVLSDYTEEEEAYLRDWAVKQGPKRVEKFFMRNILAIRPSDQELYPYSLLYKIIHSVMDT